MSSESDYSESDSNSTPIMDIENRTENILIDHLETALGALSFDVDIHHGFNDDNDNGLPAVAVEAANVLEEISSSGVMHVKVQIQAMTHRLKDKDQSQLNAIIDAIRSALLEEGIAATLSDTDYTMHSLLLADSNTIVDGSFRLWEQNLEIVMSPSD